ncbi:MAG: extracellular solute-binding protein [Bacillaceae bacterium]|nr:extracellular solute-binding protein [Bacillaceae bacterium]
MKKITFSIIFSLLALMLVACGPQDEPTPSEPKEKEESTTVDSSEPEKPEKLLIWEDQDKGIALDKAIASFEEEYGIAVEFVEVDLAKMREQLRLDGPSGNGPDIYTIPHDNIGPSVTEGLIAPIEVDEEILTIFTDSSLEAMTYNGQLYGLPKTTETPVFIYNKAYMDEAPATLDELYEFAVEFTTGDKYGFLSLWDNYYFAHGILGAYGGYVFGEADGVPNREDIGLSNDGAVEGLEYIQKWYDEGLFPSGIVGESGGATITGLFSEGKVAAVMDGPWAFQGYRDAGIDIGVAPLPPLPNGEHIKTFSGVKGWHVTSFSENKYWAQKLVEHLTNEENARYRFEKTAEIPPVKALIDDPIIASDEGSQSVALQSQYGIPMPNIPEMAEVWAPMASALQLVATGRMEPREALQQAVEQIHANIEANH